MEERMGRENWMGTELHLGTVNRSGADGGDGCTTTWMPSTLLKLTRQSSKLNVYFTAKNLLCYVNQALTQRHSYVTEKFKMLSTKVIHLCKNTATSFQEIKGTQQTANVYGKRMILECSSLLFSDLHVVCTRHKNWEKGKKKSKRTTSTALSHVFSLKYIVRFRNEISVKYFQFRLKTQQTFPKRETRAHRPTPTSRARSQT